MNLLAPKYKSFIVRDFKWNLKKGV
jgi:hypothetical protein